MGDPGTDCDSNGLMDSCQIAQNPELDCDDNGVFDLCEIQDEDSTLDCNGMASLTVANSRTTQNWIAMATVCLTRAI